MSKKIRCAIYTRKSTQDGLEQEFNSLDAQRQACEAFISSQRGMGWVCLKHQYDDGGLSGGSMDRPALQKLIEDIKAGKLDLVVVYKVDRLTRSLADFARLVELFDEHDVSFVSVTQQFNTSTSMGRLTLNVLLSFAQFEREVTGERIRDKIAASKKKGMWMGGLVPLGYDLKERKLIINPDEARTVRTLFELYRETGTAQSVLAAANQRSLMTKQRIRKDGSTTGGHTFTRGHLYHLLSNPLYAGHVRHKGKLYEGQHEAIIDRITFEEIQSKLKANAADRKSSRNEAAPNLLTGLVFDETGDRLCPSHSDKPGKRYRYYISKRLMHGPVTPGDGWRIPAKALEGAVIDGMTQSFEDQNWVLNILAKTAPSAKQLTEVSASLVELTLRLRERSVIQTIIKRIELTAQDLNITLDPAGLSKLINWHPADSDSFIIEIKVPLQLRRRGVETKLIIATTSTKKTEVDDGLVALIAQAHNWWGQLKSQSVASIEDLAKASHMPPSEVTRALPLAFLAPDIVSVILEGRQPMELTTERLKRLRPFPTDWHEQRRILGFSL